MKYLYKVICLFSFMAVFLFFPQTAWAGPDDEVYTEPHVEFTMPAYDLVITAESEPYEVPYKVEHYLQKVGASPTDYVNGYELVPEDTVVDEALTDSTVRPPVNTYTGFDSPPVRGENVNGDGSLVVKYYYLRHNYKLDLIAGTGIASCVNGGTVQYGASVTFNAVLKPGYTWKDWTGDRNTTSQEYTIDEMPAVDLTITANATPNTNTPYKVRHWTQNVDTGGKEKPGDYTLIDTVSYTGTTDTKVTPPRKDYPGFTAPAGIEVNIDGDGSMILDYYYARNFYVYVVHHHLQNIDNDEYDDDVPVEDVLFSAHHGSVVTPAVNTYVGFTSPSTQTKTVPVETTGFGEYPTQAQMSEVRANEEILEFDYYYTRNDYTITLSKGLGIDSVLGSGTFPYNKALSVDAVLKPGYHWVDWTGTYDTRVKKYEFNMPAFNVDMTSHALPDTDTKYTVQYHLQKIGAGDAHTDENYDIVPEIFRGTTDTSATPEVKPFEGFTARSTPITKNIDGTGDMVIDYWYTRNTYSYVVKYYIELLDGTWQEVVEERDNLTAQYDDVVEPLLKPHVGFTPPEQFTVNMPANDDLLVVYRYKRNYYTLNLTMGRGTVNAIKNGAKHGNTLKYQFEEEISINVEVKPGYSWSKWEGTFDVGVRSYTFNMPAENVSLTSVAIPHMDTAYTVYHYKQKIGADAADLEHGYDLVYTDHFSGETDTTVTPDFKDYPGFTPPDHKQTVNIDGTGSTTVAYYYTRNRYDYVVNYYEQNIEDDDYTLVKTERKTDWYGQEITPEVPEKVGFVTPMSQTFVIEDNNDHVSNFYYRRYKYRYRVEHYLQDIGDPNGEGNPGYTLIEDDVDTYKNVKFDAPQKPQVNLYDGFTSPEAQEFNMPANNDKVIKYYYKRNVYKYTINYWEENIEDNDYTLTDSGEFKDWYDKYFNPPVMERTGFTSPEPSPFRIPANDETVINFKYKRNTYEYKVEHYKQKVGVDADDLENGYVLVGTETFSGKYYKEQTPDVNDYTGFTSPDTETFNIPANNDKVVRYYYTRNRYDITLSEDLQNAAEINKGLSAITSLEGPDKCEFEEELTFSVTVKEGFEFVKWDVEGIPESDYLDGTTPEDPVFKFKAPAGDIEIHCVTKALIVNYQVRYWLLKAEDDRSKLQASNDYTGGYELADTEYLTGLACSTVSPEVKEFDGYVAPARVSVTLRGDGKTIVNYYYLRDSECAYTVKYYLMNDDLSTYSLDSTEQLKGTYGLDVSPLPKNYKGFITPVRQTKTLAYDGSTLFEYRYARRTDCRYTVNYNLMDETINEYVTTESYSAMAPYWTSITPPVKTYDGYMTPSPQTKRIAADGSTVFDYNYDQQIVPCTVNYWVQGENESQVFSSGVGVPAEDGKIYYLDHKEEVNVQFGSTYTPEIKHYENHSDPEVTGVRMIQRKNVINLYYPFETYNVTVIDYVPELKLTLYVHTFERPVGAELSASALTGADESDNFYYKQYRYVSDTNGVVTDEGLKLYRYFEFIYERPEVEVDMSDSGIPGASKKSCTAIIYCNGEEVGRRTVTADDLGSDDNSGKITISFGKVPKYDETGKENQYTIRYEFEYTYSLNRMFAKVSNGGRASFDAEEGSVSVSNPLGGAVFSLTPLDEDDAETRTMTTSENGTISFANIKAGDYVLKEVSAPAGFEYEDVVRYISIIPEIKNGQLVKYQIFSADNEVDLKNGNAVIVYDSDYMNAGGVAPQVIVNSQYGTIEVHVLDAVTQEGIYGDSIVVYKDTGVTDGKAYNSNMRMYNKNTDTKGNTVVSGLDYGKYKVRDDTVSTKYETLNEIVSVDLNTDRPYVQVYMYKNPKDGSVLKVDIKSGEKVSGSKSYAFDTGDGSNGSGLTDNAGGDRYGNNGNSGSSGITGNGVVVGKILRGDNSGDGSGKGSGGSSSNDALSVKTEKFNKKQIFDTAASIEGSKFIVLENEDIKTFMVRDTVMFGNYGEQGAEYEMIGYLVDKETGEAIKDDKGNTIHRRQTFVNEGLVTMELEFPVPLSALLPGRSIVVYETVVDEDGNIVKAHNDINDADQTVSIKGYEKIQTGVYPDIAGFVDRFLKFWK